jgi:hypothetical protein
MPQWQPAKPKVPIKVVECGPGKWDEQDHGLDYPGELHTIDFRVTGRGHRYIEWLFQAGCSERGRKFAPYNETQPEHRVAMGICCNASSFVLFDTKPGATVIGFVHEEDAQAFRKQFVVWIAVMLFAEARCFRPRSM